METSVTVGPVTLVTVKGDVDGRTYRELIDRCDQLIQQGHTRLILDFDQVYFMSTAGLMALQTVVKQATEKGGKVALAGLNKHVQHSIERAGFEKLMPIFGDVAAAQAGFDAG